MQKKYNNEDWLRQKYVNEELTMQEIADICDCANPTIYRKLKQSDIDTQEEGKRKKDGKHNDEDWLRQEYVEKERSAPAIAHECGVNRTTIYRRLRNFGIKVRASTPVQNKSRKVEKIDDEELRDIFNES
jgi:hypothetical protein